MWNFRQIKETDKVSPDLFNRLFRGIALTFKDVYEKIDSCLNMEDIKQIIEDYHSYVNNKIKEIRLPSFIRHDVDRGLRVDSETIYVAVDGKTIKFDQYGRLVAVITKGDQGAEGMPGMDGLSAYEIAVINGFNGTEKEWLASLYPVNGRDGLSAYELAVKNGFKGSIPEFLNSLKGQKGENGRDGKDGTNGVDGLSAYDVACIYGFIGTEKQWIDGISANVNRIKELEHEIEQLKMRVYGLEE